jgi:hypothetical protein
MPKGDYYGPDKNKGIRPTGKDKYYGPNKRKGIAPKKKAGSGTTTPKAPKVDKYQVQADELAKKQFAGAIKELAMGEESNTRNYEQTKASRAAALGAELASNKTAGEITSNTVTGLKGQALAQFAKDKATQDALSAARTGQENAVNTDALTTFQEQLKARGLEGTAQAEALTSNMKDRQGFAQGLDTIRANASTSAEQRARQLYDMTGINVLGQTNRAQAQAQSKANSDQVGAYSTYASKAAELAGTKAKTQLDQGSTAANTALTLRKEAALRKQEKAQLALERHVAGLKNAESMAKVAQTGYFKEAELGIKKAGLSLKAEDLKLKGKALDAKIAKETRAGNLGEAKLLEQIRNNNAKQRSADAKAGIKYGNTVPNNAARGN